MIEPGELSGLRQTYEHALPEVYGYLLHRCGEVSVAEDLTSEVFLAAARSLAAGSPDSFKVAWLIGVARHKLIDHWRQRAREERTLEALDPPEATDPWPEHLDLAVARRTLQALSAHHRAALTLRYVDDLPLAEVATLLHRTPQATESLLARARAAFRRVYEKGGEDAH